VTLTFALFTSGSKHVESVCTTTFGVDSSSHFHLRVRTYHAQTKSHMPLITHVRIVLPPALMKRLSHLHISVIMANTAFLSVLQRSVINCPSAVVLQRALTVFKRKLKLELFSTTYRLPISSTNQSLLHLQFHFLGPFHGAIAVPSVTRCRCCCRCRCGHRFYIAIHQVSLLSHTACAIAIAGFGSSW